MLKGRTASIAAIRAAYRGWTGHDWPYDDAYARELTREGSTIREVLMLMRECHVIDDLATIS